MYYLVFVTVISEGFTATVRLKTAVNLVWFLWCLMPLSTLFHYIVAVSFNGGGKWSARRKPAVSHWQTVSFYVLSSTPCHEIGWNSQL